MTLPPQKRRLAQKLFEGALERRPEERRSYLENACPEDHDLRLYVDGWLRPTKPILNSSKYLYWSNC